MLYLGTRFQETIIKVWTVVRLCNQQYHTLWVCKSKILRICYQGEVMSQSMWSYCNDGQYVVGVQCRYAYVNQNV